MFKPLHYIVDRVVRRGSLTLMTSDGRRHQFGDGSGRPVVVRFTDRRLERQLTFDAHLIAGEAYMDGRLVMEQGQIYDLLALFLENAIVHPMPRLALGIDYARYMTRRLAQFNPAHRSRRNVAHHYDIDGSIYDLFLDRERQYSCAYFEANDGELDKAQQAKLDHIAAKLALKNGSRVLDIGSGWGGLALHLARRAHASVDGVTLSVEQLKGARARADALGLSQHVKFDFKDYRDIDGAYDRIVSVGMFEHVGINHYDAYFRKLRDLMNEDGVALVHFIGRTDRPTITNPFIAKYIFPGGYIPALSEVMPAIERSGLVTTDIEVLRLHYAETLRRWRERFLAHWSEAARIRDERFCRMWEFYLAGSECAFRYQNLVVFQIQLAKRTATLPLTRDYIQAEEHRYRTEVGSAWAGGAGRRLAGE